MDGVIYHGNQILPGVPEFIQWLHDEKKEYLFLTMMEIQSPCVRFLYLNIPQPLSPMGERGCGIFGWICKVVAMLFLRRQYYIVTFYSWIKNIFFIKGKNTTPT